MALVQLYMITFTTPSHTHGGLHQGGVVYTEVVILCPRLTTQPCLSAVALCQLPTGAASHSAAFPTENAELTRLQLRWGAELQVINLGESPGSQF